LEIVFPREISLATESCHHPLIRKQRFGNNRCGDFKDGNIFFEIYTARETHAVVDILEI
jgi:hypothetical protein